VAAALHREELLANWDRARRDELLERIEPLSYCGMVAIPPLIPVTGVAVIGDYQLRLLFEDGTVGDVSFEHHEWNGVFEPLRDPVVFAEVYVDTQFGTLAWPNGLDMAPEPLYEEALRNRIAEPLSHT
jgi:hypothetical protein